MKKEKLEMEVIDDPRLNALGRYFDKHPEETDAELECGNVYTAEELGCPNAFEAGRKVLAIEAAKKKKAERKMYSFRLPVFVVDGLKKKARAQRKPYQRFVNEVLAIAAR